VIIIGNALESIDNLGGGADLALKKIQRKEKSEKILPDT
jgi:hypothetical protein